MYYYYHSIPLNDIIKLVINLSFTSIESEIVKLRLLDLQKYAKTGVTHIFF